MPATDRTSAIELLGAPIRANFKGEQIWLNLFISYVRENLELVDQLAKELTNAGVTVWLDRNDIEPGSRWREAIQRAIRNGKFFLACFSQESNDRDGSHMREEITLAIEELRLSPFEKNWFIPVILNKANIPSCRISSMEDLSDIQSVFLYRIGQLELKEFSMLAQQ